MPQGIQDNGQIHCSKCGKTMSNTNFYTYKDGSKCELCKACLTMHINNWEEDTYLWLLEKFDVPYLPWEWNSIRDKAYQKDPYKMTGMSVFGKYLSKMKLKQFKTDKETGKPLGFADSERLQFKHEQEAQAYGTPDEVMQQKIEEMREAHERGEITDAQWQTYQQIEAPKPQSLPEPVTTQNDPYPANSNFEKVDIPDVRENLSEEDKIYLAIKWGRLYQAEEWVTLEKLYNEFMNTFDIQGAARIDTLKKICKTSLKMDQAIDCGDVDTYQKLSRVYDSLMKSAKFTEAQRKEEKSGEFDSVGQIVYYAEKEGGAIPRHEITTPIDIVDKAIADLKKYNKDLIVNDPALSQMFENFIKRRESIQEHKEDMKNAEAAGLDQVELEDKDYAEFNQLLVDEKAKDQELFEQEGEEE